MISAINILAGKYVAMKSFVYGKIID